MPECERVVAVWLAISNRPVEMSIPLVRANIKHNRKWTRTTDINFLVGMQDFEVFLQLFHSGAEGEGLSMSLIVIEFV